MPHFSSSSVLPKRVKVAFPTRRNYSSLSSFPPEFYVSTVNLPTAFTKYTLDGFDGDFTIHDTAVAVYNSSAGPPVNQAALDYLAEQIAFDYYDSLDRVFDLTMAGVCDIEPNANTNTIIIDYFDEYCTTRMVTDAIVPYPTYMSHWDSSVSSYLTYDDAPGIRLYSPDLSASIVAGNTKVMLAEALILDGRFERKKKSAVTIPCGCVSTCTLTVNVNGCGGLPLAGANVHVIQGGTIIRSGTTDGSGAVSFSVDPGTYTVNVSPGPYDINCYDLPADQNITIGPDCTPNSLTFNLNFFFLLCFNGDPCGSTTSTWSVALSDTGGSLGTCTGTVNGCCKIYPVRCPTGTVSAVFTWKGRTYTKTFAWSLGQCIIGARGSDHVCVKVLGCCNLPVSGISVAFSLAGYGPIGTGTTDANGVACITSTYGLDPIAPDSITASISAQLGFSAATQTFNISLSVKNNPDCSTPYTTFNLTPDANHVCFGVCAIPADTRIPFTFNDGFGVVTMTWNAGHQRWIGCVMRNASFVYYPPCGFGGTGTNVMVPIFWSIDPGFCTSPTFCYILNTCNVGSDCSPLVGWDCSTDPLALGYNCVIGSMSAGEHQLAYGYTCTPTPTVHTKFTINDLFTPPKSCLARIYGYGTTLDFLATQ